MPMSHKVMKQKIKRRLKGKVGKEKQAEIHRILEELPNYRSGPYADLRKSLNGEIQQQQKRAKIQHKDTLAVEKEGHFQMALVGAPNAGKSALLKALSRKQIKVADYPFTTLKPIPTRVDCGGLWIQLVEIPGLIAGATEGRGGGQALLSVAANADGLMIAHDLTTDPQELNIILTELSKTELPQPLLIVYTKIDNPGAENRLRAAQTRFSQFKSVAVSAEQNLHLETLKETMRASTGLIRVFPRSNQAGSKPDETPVIIPVDNTVEDFAHKIHKDIAQKLKHAKVWGNSVKFPGQQVGKGHVLSDMDIVTLYTT